MLGRRRSAWRRLAALPPLLLLALSSLPGEALLRCQMDGLLRSTCCCPPARAPGRGLAAAYAEGAAHAAGAATVEAAALRARDCCAREESTTHSRPVVEAARSAAGEIEGAAARLSALPLAETITPPAPLPSPQATRQRHGPAAGTAPPLVLLKQSFLI